jgi:3-hydroxyanthranilate 3,4-dioxygenase
MEVYRDKDQEDGFQWYCENCGNLLYEEYAHVSDIVNQLPVIMNNFFDNKEHRTCDNCGTVMEKPEAATAKTENDAR